MEFFDLEATRRTAENCLVAVERCRKLILGERLEDKPKAMECLNFIMDETAKVCRNVPLDAPQQGFNQAVSVDVILELHEAKFREFLEDPETMEPADLDRLIENARQMFGLLGYAARHASIAGLPFMGR